MNNQRPSFDKRSNPHEPQALRSLTQTGSNYARNIRTNYGGDGRNMAPQNTVFSNSVDSNEWIASIEQENHYMARQILQLEEDKKRLLSELNSNSRRSQDKVVKLSDYEQVTRSLELLEDKSAKLEDQLLKAKEYIDMLSETTSRAREEQSVQQNELLTHQLEEIRQQYEAEMANQAQVQSALNALQTEHNALLAELQQMRSAEFSVTKEEYSQLAEEKLALVERLTTLETENDKLVEQLSENSEEIASRAESVDALNAQLKEALEKQAALQEEADDSKIRVGRLSATVETLQHDLMDEKNKHLVDPKTSIEYVALLEENIRLRSIDPRETAAYMELLTQKNLYEQKYKSYNPKASKEYLELLVITERQRAQIAEMIANKEMIRITQEEIADILSEAQHKARKIVDRAEERADEIVRSAENKITRKQTSLAHFNEDLKGLISNSVDAFSRISTDAEQLDDELALIPEGDTEEW